MSVTEMEQLSSTHRQIVVVDVTTAADDGGWGEGQEEMGRGSDRRNI